MVNSLYDLFDAPGAKPDAEQLIVNGRYMLPPIGDPTGKRRSLQRVTNFIKQISDTEGLTKWRLRQVVLGLALREDLYDVACSLDPMQKGDTDKLVEQAIEAAKTHGSFVSGGNETGTALHNYTDHIGHEPARLRPKWAPKVENYRRALHEQGLRAVPGLSERLVVSERYGTCGRLDDVYEDVYGIRYVADRKSQKDFYTWFEVGAQLALYQGSDAMWNEQTCSWEDMPQLSDHKAIVAWMPLALPGPDPEGVELYDVELESPRALLDEILLVRTLRTQARKWGAPMLPLTDFERTARDIRDADSQDDLQKIRFENLAQWNESLNQMAMKRWDELAVKPANFVPAVPLAPGVAVQRVSAYATPDVSPNGAVTAPLGSLSGDPATRALQYAAADLVAPPAEVQLDWSKIGADLPRPHAGIDVPADTSNVPADWRKLAELFKSPEDATFPQAAGPADDVGAAVPAPARVDDPDLRKPIEWLTEFAEGLTLKADPEGRWRTPMTRSEFEYHYGQEIELHQSQGRGLRGSIEVTEPRPASAQDVLQATATVVELPGVEAPATTDYHATIEALDNVPIKVVREVCTRAKNSGTNMGRVRLLNDVEDKKYARHQAALMPALLAEWLAVDDGATEDPTGQTWVTNTGGSKRPPMRAHLAGLVSLSRYLTIKGEDVPDGTPKKGSAAPAQGDTSTDAFGQPVADDVQLKDSVDIGKAITLPTIDPDRPVHVYGDRETVRHQYADIQPDKHSIARLVEMAQQAVNGAERAKVFHEITRRKAWTGEIAADINQYYLDHGYATVDFDPYFEATAIESAVLPLDPDDPATAEDAVHLLGGVRTRAELTLMWAALAAKPYFHDAKLQEALMLKMQNAQA